MNLGPHAAFILAAYAAAIIVIGGLIAWVTLDHRAQKRLLGELDSQGVRRRSTAAVKEPA
ncbi:heme exporter protein CcmD [Xanthobacteraceae bacterium Astr-EGSB]|uniref:heme exporter protein CcmD n=1 Tax=Astrobacterium formosum TaxID=3069710 RepID=UPI0027B391D8|nr:heme exporter protein CcmD [Xanthobacteraceae bacterium Astr-EGSB]